MRTFICNFCKRVIPFHLFGQPTIKCLCGAKYHKQVVVEIAEINNDNT